MRAKLTAILGTRGWVFPGQILLLLSACHGPLDQYEDAPGSPDALWNPPSASVEHDQGRGHYLAGEGAAGRPDGDSLDRDHEYTLPELIDFSQRHHPETRVAWERARIAAAELGIAESAYAPTLTLSAAAGYEHLFFPFPDVPLIGITDGFITADAYVVSPTLRLNWLLFDFGRRSAQDDASRERVLVANFGFNAVHHRLVFNVTRAYYAFIDARDRVAVAVAEVEAARTVEDAVVSKQANGLATELDLLQSRRATIKAVFEYEVATSNESDARVALAEAVGVLPTTQFGIANLTHDVPTEEVLEAVDDAIDHALAQRPDLSAMLAEVRAREADVRLAKSNFNPVVSMTGSVSMPYEALSVESSQYFTAIEPRYGAGIMLSWPLYDGGERSQTVLKAMAACRAAEDELLLARDAAVREVWKAYTNARLAMRRKPVSDALLAASEQAYNSTVEAYRQGVGDTVQVIEAQRNLTAARAITLDTKTAVYTSLAALALATGEIANH